MGGIFATRGMSINAISLTINPFAAATFSYNNCKVNNKLSTQVGWSSFLHVPQEHDRQYMHIGTMVEFAFALVGKLDVINKHSFNDFRLRIGENILYFAS